MIKKLYLASSVNMVAGSIAKDISKNPKKLKLAFINTASEVEKGDLQWLEDDRNGIIKAGFKLLDYTITGKKPKDIEKDLKDMDIIHVNGGNSFYLLIQIKKSGFDKWVRNAVNQGKIYTGSSAGSMVASPDIGIAKRIETGNYDKKLKNHKALGLVNFIVLPHWGSDYFKDMYLDHRLDVAYRNDNKIILLSDYQYVRVEDNTYQIVDIRD